jgi:hypothetical protein
MLTFRPAFTFGCLVSIAALGCGGSDEEGGAAGGTGGQLATGGAAGAAGAAGSATGGSSSGGAPGTSVCPGVKGSCASPDVSKCAEYGGTQGDETFVSLEANCTDPNVWVAGACTDTGKIGSCKLETPNGPCNTIVFYDPLTAADGETECTTLNGTWVP